MSNKYFGTDGIRGTVNKGNITGEKFFKFGLAAATYFKNQKKTKQIAIIAKDTRLSGYTLEPALVSGLASGGMHIFTLGPLPTNGLAMLTKSMKANMGIMITASHNPYYDNGLKLFGPDGMKLSDKIEKKIEKLIDAKSTKQLTNPKMLGRGKRLEDGNDKYIEIIRKNFPSNFNLKGTKIVLDCGNGAGYIAAPKLLKKLGAKVISIGVKPNGFNINDKCGSTYPFKIKSTVKKVRRLGSSEDVIAGFAGSTADAFALFERLESKLEQHTNQLKRACVELAKDWRTDRYLRRLEAMMIVADKKISLLISGTGDVIEPDDGILGIYI